MAKYIHVLTVRVTAPEYQNLRESSKAAGMSLSKYIRKTLIDKPYEDPELLNQYHSLVYEVNRIGNNINQIAYLHNTNMFDPNDIKQVLSLMSDLRELLYQYSQFFRR